MQGQACGHNLAFSCGVVQHLFCDQMILSQVAFLRYGCCTSMPHGGGFLGRLPVGWAGRERVASFRVVLAMNTSAVRESGHEHAHTGQRTAAYREARCSGHENVGNWIARHRRTGDSQRRFQTRGFGTSREQGSSCDLCVSLFIFVANMVPLPSEVVWLWAES